MRRLNNLLLSLVLVTLALSCVPSRKFKEVNAEASALKAQTANLEDQVQILNSKNDDLSTKNETLVTEFQNYRSDCEASLKELHSMRQILDEEEENLMLVQEKLMIALEDFHAAGVEVYYKDGLLRVQLAEDLLYRSGSSVLDSRGQNALASLATVLNDYPRLRVIVVGNTDNVKFKNGKDNWTLSTERANGIVRILSNEYNVDASRLTAAGKAEYNPLADNSTGEGRSQNRRIDIVLNPDIDRIWNNPRSLEE